MSQLDLQNSNEREHLLQILEVLGCNKQKLRHSLDNYELVGRAIAEIKMLHSRLNKCNKYYRELRRENDRLRQIDIASLFARK